MLESVKMVEKKVSKKSEFRKDLSFNPGFIAYIIGIIAIVEAIVSPMAGIILAVIGLSFANKGEGGIAAKAKKYNLIALIVGIIIFVVILIVTSFVTPLANIPFK